MIVSSACSFNHIHQRYSTCIAPLTPVFWRFRGWMGAYGINVFHDLYLYSMFLKFNWNKKIHISYHKQRNRSRSFPKYHLIHGFINDVWQFLLQLIAMSPLYFIYHKDEKLRLKNATLLAYQVVQHFKYSISSNFWVFEKASRFKKCF